MKKKMEEITQKEKPAVQEKKISRKEAIKKSGFMVLSAATMLLLLNNPSQAQASPAPPPHANPHSGGGHGPWKKKN